MGPLILVFLIIGLCAYFIARGVYKSQVKNQYKSPEVTAVIIFILVFAILTGGILLAASVMFRR